MFNKGKLLPWNKLVKQFKLLRVTCDLSAILHFVEKEKHSPDNFLRASEHTQKITFELYNYITKFWFNSQNEQNWNIS